MATRNTQVTGQESTIANPQHRVEASEAAIGAPVDILEDSDNLILIADMPGVSKERLDVRIDGATLVVEGRLQFDLPENAEALYADVRAAVYRRSFTLSRELDSEHIQANLKDGVLTVRIPKRSELRPRKIEVHGA
jgi:HSP20 family molecular chaperone IbpA